MIFFFSRYLDYGFQSYVSDRDSRIIELYYPDSKTQISGFQKQTLLGSGFHEENFPRFRNLDSLSMGKYLHKEKKFYSRMQQELKLSYTKSIPWAKGFCVPISRDIENQIRSVSRKHHNWKTSCTILALNKVFIQSRVSCKRQQIK